MKHIISRLKALSTVIEQLLNVSSSAGVSIGVLHHSQPIYTSNFGNRDVEAATAPDENTIYHLASLSKFMTVAGIGILVDDGELSWNTPVSKVLEEFHERTEGNITISDLLSHRSGLAASTALVMGDQGRLLLKPGDLVRTSNDLKPVAKVGSKFLYNNWGFGLADNIIERVSNQTFGDFLQRRLFGPLGLQRTLAGNPHCLNNVAISYVDSGTSTPTPMCDPQPGSGTAFAGATGVKSSVHDLLILYREFMLAHDDQLLRNSTSTPNSPFRQTMEIVRPHITICNERHNYEPQTAYAMGWLRYHLPSPMSSFITPNARLIEDPPTIGVGLKDHPLVLAHSGSLPGSLASVMLIPQTHSAIVVLVNTQGNSDTANWIGQAVLENLLDTSEKHDFVQIAKLAAEKRSLNWLEMHQKLQGNRTLGTPLRPAIDFVGIYWNPARTVDIKVFQGENDQLYFSLGKQRKDHYRLHHYHFDILSWEVDREEAARRGRWPITSATYYLFEFQGGASGEPFTNIIWRHDSEVPEGETFTRQQVVYNINFTEVGESQNVL
jgi:CubicO group peptidase (beta-lactamase class C family)